MPATTVSAAALANVERFIRELENVGGSAIVASETADVTKYLSQIVNDNGVKTGVQSSQEMPGKMDLSKIFSDLGVKIYEPDNDIMQFREIVERAELGISAAQFAIAATGTLVLETEREVDRWVSSLPPVYLQKGIAI